MEYALILFMLKKRRKPKYSIDSGLRKMFKNGDASNRVSDRLNENRSLEVFQIGLKQPNPPYYVLASEANIKQKMR